jgi:hypothetical protein
MSLRNSWLVRRVAPTVVAALALEDILLRLQWPRPLPAVESAWLRGLRRDGLVIVPGYRSAAECRRLLAEIEAVARRHPDYVQTASNGADRRIYGVDVGSAPIRATLHDPPLFRLSRQVLGPSAVAAFALSGEIEAQPGNLGSGEGWHRDAFFGQVKAILYLTDVDETNGPFQYIRQSHRLASKYGDHARYGAPLLDYRMSDTVVERLVASEPDRLVSVCGRAGALILVDTSGIHRGKPLTGGRRVALTNYYHRRGRLLNGKTLERFRPVLGVH